MKIKSIILILVISFLNSIYAQMQYKVKINNTIYTNIVGKDNITYVKIKQKDLFNESKVGAPNLPVKYVHLIIPSQMDVKNVIYKYKIRKKIKLKYKVYPTQKVIYDNKNNTLNEFVQPDAVIYNSKNAWPEKVVEFLHSDFVDNNNHIITLKVIPYQYYPNNDILEELENIDISIEFKQSNKRIVLSKIRTYKTQELWDNILVRIVDNPEDIVKYQVKPKLIGDFTFTKNTLKKPTPVKFYEYVIITSSTLKTGFDDFISWMKRKGVDIGVVTTSSINYYYTGDNISGIYDDAGKIRQYLIDAYELGTTWVLLGGDINIVAGRLGLGDDNNLYLRGYSDLYFADINGDWEVDNDGNYGEPNDDNVDYGPEMFVGRLLCSTTQDIQKWTNKLLKYEQNPGNGNFTYLNRNIMIEADEQQANNSVNNVINYQPQNFTTLKYKELPSYNSISPTAPYANNIINEFNNTKYGLWFWYLHGTTTKSITMSSDINGGAISYFNTSNLQNLNNYNYPAILYSISCDNTRFEANPNLGRYYTVGINGGGPAFLGNSSKGGIDQYTLAQKFVDLLVDDDEIQKESILNIGMTEYISKYNHYFHLYRIFHNLIGCPEMPLWNNVPKEFNNVTIIDGGNYVTVKTGVSNCTISVISTDNGDSYWKTVHNKSVYTFYTSVRPLYITITKKFYLPYTALTGGTLNETIKLSGKVNLLKGLNGGLNAKVIILPNTEIRFNKENTFKTDNKIVLLGNQIKDIYKIKYIKSIDKNNININIIKKESNIVSNYPNPFNPYTNIHYNLKEQSDVKIKIFNILGQLVKYFELYNQTEGMHSLIWHADNDTGVKVPSGIYFLRIEIVPVNSKIKPFSQTLKLLLNK